MTDEQNSKCRKIIHRAAAVSAIAGLGVAMVSGFDSVIDDVIVGVIRIIMLAICVLEIALVTEGTGWGLAFDLSEKERKQAESQKDEAQSS